jgi:hypothetical protein
MTLLRCVDSLAEVPTMEKFTYRDVTFNVIRTLSCERTRVHDAANNYLHTDWEVTVACLGSRRWSFTRAKFRIAPWPHQD